MSDKTVNYTEQDLERAIEFCNRNSIDTIADVWIAELIAQVRAETFDQFWDYIAAHYDVPTGKYTPVELIQALDLAVLRGRRDEAKDEREDAWRDAVFALAAKHGFGARSSSPLDYLDKLITNQRKREDGLIHRAYWMQEELRAIPLLNIPDTVREAYERDQKSVMLKPATFTKRAEHFKKVTTPVDVPCDDAQGV